MIRKKKSQREHWDRFWRAVDTVDEVYSNEGRVASQIEQFLSVEGKRILEVGAGSGRDGIQLAANGARVVSLDYSIPSLSMIGSQLDGRTLISLCCGDAFSLPFEDETFDVVFHQGLLEHFRNPGDLIAENRRVLKKGGLLLVDVPQRYHYYTVIKHLMIALGSWFAGWETEYSAGQLERLLERHSFSIVSSFGEWFNPPIWYRMLRRAALRLGLHLPMYPRLFTLFRSRLAPVRSFLLRRRLALYTTVVVGTVARKE
jgi:ubiquinone/menaquinone biosynthesis C-methylase UbiE